MRKNYIDSLNKKKHVYSVENFFSMTNLALNCIVGNTIDYEVLSESVFSALGTVDNMAKTDNAFWFLLTDGTLKKVDLDTFDVQNVIGSFSQMPLIQGVIIGGKQAYVIVDGYNTIVVGADANINIANGDLIGEYGGRVFTAKDYTLSFGGPFDFDDFSYTATYGTITLPNQTGKIVGIEKLNKTLYVFCESGIYQLTENESVDFTLNRVNTCVCGIVKNSVKNIGGRILFLCGKNLYSFDGNKTSKIDSLLDDLRYYYYSFAVCDDKYIISLGVDDRADYFAFVYEGATGKQYFAGISSSIVTEGGYFLSETNDYVCKLFNGRGEIFGQTCWESKVIDFNQPYKKALTEVSIYASNYATLIVSGDFGKKTLSLEKGKNIKRVNLYSHDFTIRICDIERPCYVRDLKLKYTVTGE